MQNRIIALQPMALAVALAWAAPAQAQQQTEQRLPEVKVQASPQPETAVGPDLGYSAKRSATATKTDTPLAETPQSVTVITRERIEDQGATSLQDALNYAAGVRSDAYGLDSRSDGVRVRGGYPSEYRDGLRRQVGGYYTSTTRIEPYSLERIEVLRGPAAMLYGQGSTAGVINSVSKRPQAEAQREIGVQLGNYGRKQLQADLTGPLTQDGDWLYRIVALGRDSDTQVDYVPDDRSLLAPSLTWKPNAMTSLTLQALWQKDKSGSTSQFFPWEGVVLPNPNGPIPVNRFIGQPGLDHYNSERMETGWLFEHRFNEQWTLRQNLRYSENEVSYFSVYGDSFSGTAFTDPARSMIGRYGYFDQRKVDLLTTDQHIEGRLQTGAVKHQLLVGLETVRHRESTMSSGDNPAAFGGGIPDINVYSPVYPAYTPPALAALPDSAQTMTGIYLQDQMKISERWIVVAGIRSDRAINKLAGAADEKDTATTKRGGLMYLFDNGISPYFSYSESFTPITGTNFFGQRYKPLRGKQNEVGVKYQPPAKQYTVTAAVYDLKEKNQQTADPNNALNTIQVGSTRNQGAELEFTGRALRWLDVAAHYNYIDIDEKLENMPRHQIAVWGSSRFAIGDTGGFLAGLGVRYMSDFADGVAPTTPNLTLLDGMIGFESGPWRYALNIQNLTDKTYVATCLSRGDCWFGAKRTAVLSARYRF
jgi:iron complex outermembrane receptor protein